MRTFTLSYQADGLGEAKSIKFEGVDPSPAFPIAEREGIGRHAVLREGGVILGHIERLQSGVWRLTNP